MGTNDSDVTSSEESVSSEPEPKVEEVKTKKKTPKKKSKKKDDKKEKSKKKDLASTATTANAVDKARRAFKKGLDKKKPTETKKVDSDLEDGHTPAVAKNPDGSIWENPLKFWTNKPKKLNEVGVKVIMKPNKGSDIFCRTQNSLTDSACFYWLKFDGDFNVLVKIKGTFGSAYDKAGIMLRKDERNWVLSGLEYFGGRVCFSTCITRGITDWSLAPMADEKKASDEGVWIAIKRQEGRVACFYSTDLNEWVQTRMGEFEESDEPLKVGLAAACPQGEPYKVVFERFGIQAM